MSLRFGVLGTQLLIALAGTGCRAVWHEPRSLPLYSVLRLSASVDEATLGGPEASLRAAREFAADAALAEGAGSVESVDKHYQAAVSAWWALNGFALGTDESQTAWEIYHTSVARLVATARDHGRFLPGQGVVVNDVHGQTVIPLALYGFPWRREDFQALHPVGEYRARAVSRQYRNGGWGVPLVVERQCPTGSYPEEAFLQPESMFAATALLRPCATGGAVLELFDPLRSAGQTTLAGGPLATDISAPFALRVASSPEVVRDWVSFFGIDVPTREGLFFIEPYQRGKIPVVLIHGLLSNSAAWIDMANDLRSSHGFADRFQLWGFRYSTGDPFLESASGLRRDLYRAVATVDPHGADPALRQIVLVGHSMGGLVAELQAVASGDRLWNAAANRPLQQIVTTDESRRALADMFFFAPQPNVRRVIFLATPHQGSNWATRPIGRLGSLLAQTDPTRAARHEQLMRDNPGVFSSEVAGRAPTSIDMLNPDSAILHAIETLPANPCVRFNTVFGYGKFNLAAEEGDGVVTMESAVTPRAESQVGLRASHAKIHREPETVVEIVRILREHLQQFDAMATPACGGMWSAPTWSQQKVEF